MHTSFTYLPYRSLIYNLKRKGPKTLTRGTPCLGSNQFAITTLTETCCKRSVRKHFMKCNAEFESLDIVFLFSKRLGLIVSQKL